MMLNQNSINTEANNSGVFLKNYIDYVEEVPNDLSKVLSRCREVDYKTKNLTCEIEKICEQMLSSPTDKKARIKMQQLLAKLTELKDEKIHLSQSLAAHIESKHRIVVDSFQHNVFIKQERSPTPSSKNSNNSQQQAAAVTANVKQLSTTVISSANSTPTENLEKGGKRVRKTRIDNLDVDSFDDHLLLPPVKSVAQSSTQSTSNTAKRVNTNVVAKKAKKRKTTKKQITTQIAQETIDEVIQDDGIDPDETTYCICQQISYGEMIFCENDTCPIEWFHFSCVDLTTKPKGRWFCPQCRGDKASVINKSLRKKQQEAAAI